MFSARLYSVFVLLLYLKVIHGQQASTNNQNIGVNNVMELQQQNLQRAPNNANQIPNRPGININLAQSNLQAGNMKQVPTPPDTKQGNIQQTSNLPPNLQSQGVNNLQITKIGFSPVPPVISSPSAPTMHLQSTGITPNGQHNPQVQTIPSFYSPITQIPNGPSTFTLGDIIGLKGQSLLSFINAQNNGQLQENQQNFATNTISAPNQLTDMQKQFLMRSFQAQNSMTNQQGLNIIQTPPRAISVDNQQAITVHAMQSPQQTQPRVTPLASQPAYITVQAQPLTEYLHYQAPTTATEDPIVSFILSELGPQYTINASYPPPKKASKINLKSLVPLIINLLKEKKSCGCRNCRCQNNDCQDDDFPTTTIESQIAEIFGGYSNQKKYGQGVEGSPIPNAKKTRDDESKNNETKVNKKKIVPEDTDEISEEDVSDYVDED